GEARLDAFAAAHHAVVYYYAQGNPRVSERELRAKRIRYMEETEQLFAACVRTTHQGPVKSNNASAYLAVPETKLPRPRFQVLVTPEPLTDWEITSDGAVKNVGRRKHRRTNRTSLGRPLYGWDVFLGPKVMRLVREGLTRELAVGRVAFTLGST